MANAGTTTITWTENNARNVVCCNIAWTASGTATWEYDGLGLYGSLSHVTTFFGATAPTDNSDLAIYETGTTSPNMAGTSLDNCIDNATNNLVAITLPVTLCGLYDLVITNNAVNSATGTIRLYLRW